MVGRRAHSRARSWYNVNLKNSPRTGPQTRSIRMAHSPDHGPRTAFIGLNIRGRRKNVGTPQIITLINSTNGWRGMDCALFVPSTGTLDIGARPIGVAIRAAPPFAQRLWLICNQNQKALHLLSRYIFNRTAWCDSCATAEVHPMSPVLRTLGRVQVRETTSPEISISLVDSLYKDGPTFLVGTILVTVPAFIIYWKTGEILLLGCALAIVLVACVRGLLMYAYFRLRSTVTSVASATRWERCYLE